MPISNWNVNKQMLADRRIVIVQYSSNETGSTVSGLISADGFKEAGWETHVIFGFDGPAISRYRTGGHIAYIIPHKNWLRRTQPDLFLRDLYHEWKNRKPFISLIKSIQPDLIYINTMVSLSAVLAARKVGLPVVWHIREYFSDIGGEMKAPVVFRPVIQILLKKLANKLIATSQAVAGNVLGDRNSQLIEIIPNSVGREYFDNASSRAEARVLLNLPQDRIIIGVPGSLRPVKGHHFLFRSVASLLIADPRIVVAVTGTGNTDYVRELVEAVDRSGLGEQILFLDSVANMPAFYRSCELICVPSKAETFGRVIIEAFASKTPVIATEVGGMVEIIRHGENGLLCEYGNENELRDSITSLLLQPDLAQELAAQAFSDAQRKYTAEMYQQRLSEIVNQVV